MTQRQRQNGHNLETEYKKQTDIFPAVFGSIRGRATEAVWHMSEKVLRWPKLHAMVYDVI